MSYPQRPPRSIRRYVLDDERIVLATRHHWARLLEPVTTALVAPAVVWLLVGLGRQAVGARADVLAWLVVPVLARTLLRVAGWFTEWFVATDRRMLLLTGIVTQRVAMMPLHKVTDMSYSRSVLGRLVGYGELVLESAGQDQAMRRITFVPNPDRNYRTLCATMFAPGAAAAPPGGPVRVPGQRASRVPSSGPPTIELSIPLVVPPAVPPVIPPVVPRPRPADDGAHPPADPDGAGAGT